MALRAGAIGMALMISASASIAAEPDELLPGNVAAVKPATFAKFVAKPVKPALFDLPDPSNDPAIHGATLRFFDTELRPDSDFTFALPAGGGWKLIGSPDGVKGYKYTGTGEAGDPCKVVIVTAKVVKAVCKGEDVGFTLPFEGNLGVILTVGTGPKTYCAEFGGTPKGDETVAFKRIAAPAPDVCPTNTVSTTTTTAPTTTTTEATTSTTDTTTTTAPTTTTTQPAVYHNVSVTSATPGQYPPIRPGGGSISSSPMGIDGCSAGSTCSAPFEESSTVVLTATEDSTSSFSGWTNCPSPSGNTCTIPNLAGPVSVTASFTRVYRTLTVVGTAGTGQGTVTSSSIPGTTAINCGYASSTAAACSEPYVIDSTPTLTATPRDSHSVFAGWSTGCTSASGNTCDVTVDADKTITATFDLNCSNEGGGLSCGAATNLGTITPGTPVVVSGRTLQFGDSDWYVASFGAVCGDGTPRVQISNDPTGTFRLDLYTSCAGFPQSTCWSGGGAGTTDTQYNCPTCASAPWPSTLYFRVYRVGENKPSCAQYTVTVSR